MSINPKTAGSALFLAVALIAVNLVQAQPRPSAAAPAAPAASQPVGSDEVFSRWDTDHNKSLSREEFKVGWDQVQANLLIFKLRETFASMDTNKDGVLEAPEYANLELVRKAGASAPPMSTFDTNKSQTLDFKEYVGFIKAMVRTKP
jgi:hypothetical protein